MKQKWVVIILISLLCMVVFCQVATTLHVFSVGDLPLNFVAALLEAVITAVITVVLLTGQSAAEEVKERNVKVFEKKSELFLNYIDMLWKAAEDQQITAAEYEELRKNYSIRLMIYLKEKSSKEIADYLKALGDCVDSRENVYDKIKENVFGIINVLSAELQLGGKIDLAIDKKLEEPIFPLLFKQAVLNELNRSLTSKELSEGAYYTGEALFEGGEWIGEYIAFDFRRFKGCKLVIGPFSKYRPDFGDHGGLWMLLFVEPSIHEIDEFRYKWNKSLIEIKHEGKWAEITGLYPYSSKTYAALGEFKRSDDWKGMFFDDLDSIKDFRNTYKNDANVIARRAAYWFQHGKIDGRSIKDFLETYLGREAMMIKPALKQKLNWSEHEWNKALIGEAVNDEIYLGFECGINRIGFTSNRKKLKKYTCNWLAQILDSPEFEEHFSPTDNQYKKEYVGKKVLSPDFNSKKPEEMRDFILEKCQLLQVRLRLRDTVREQLINELGFAVFSKDNFCVYKNVTDKVAVCFYSYNRHRVGFCSEGNHIKDKLKEQLQKILDDAAPKEYFEPTEDDWGQPPGRWFVKVFSASEYNGSLPDTADYIIERCRLLEENVRKTLEA